MGAYHVMLALLGLHDDRYISAATRQPPPLTGLQIDIYLPIVAVV
jgi:hypothetical protein